VGILRDVHGLLSSTDAVSGKERDHLEHFSLYRDVKPVRSKVLAHNDRDTALADVSLGAFPSGKDEMYFDDLQRFVNLVHEKSIGGPYPFHEFAKADARLVIDDLLRATHLHDELAESDPTP
jgi:hypothetical protein